jgi:hypothetical protein
LQRSKDGEAVEAPQSADGTALPLAPDVASLAACHLHTLAHASLLSAHRPAKVVSVGEALAGCHPGYTILSARGITFVPEMLCSINPVQYFEIEAGMQCYHTSESANSLYVELSGALQGRDLLSCLQIGL